MELNLEHLRTEKGLTQKQLARLSGVSQACISEIEAGKKSPTLRVLAKIATALGMPVSRLLDEVSPREVTANA